MPSAHRPLLFLVVLALVASPVPAARVSPEAVKAAYLFRFASYVEWPASANGDGPFVIGVIGAEDVAVHLQRLLNGMSVRGRAAEVRRVRAVGDLNGVHILFVGAKVFRSSRPLRLHAIERPILLVTDHRDGFAGGAIINFVEVNLTLRFEVSLDAAERSALKIDSALLAVAARVVGKRQQE